MSVIAADIQTPLNMHGYVDCSCHPREHRGHLIEEQAEVLRFRCSAFKTRLLDDRELADVLAFAERIAALARHDIVRRVAMKRAEFRPALLEGSDLL